jgi:periplasmic mercuric ion binding protein
MKTIKYLTTGVIALLLIVGMTRTYAGPASKSETIKMKVEFTCAGCQTKIQNGLGKTEGVEKAVADLSTKIVTITYDPAKTNKDKLVKAIEGLGYKTEFSAAGTKPGHDCTDEKGPKGSNCTKTCPEAKKCTGDKK